MEKVDRIYHIEEERKLAKRGSIGQIVTYGLWLGSYIALPQFYSLPALAAYLTATVYSSVHEGRITKSVEYKRFKEIYIEIIKEYIKLNENFDLKTPIDIYALFDLAYANNFLSVVDQDYKNRITKYDVDLTKELALNNYGVCKHIAAMLSDIYTQMGYTASPIVVASQRMKEEVKEVELPREVEEEMKRIQNMIQIEINGQVINPFEVEVGKPKMFESHLIPQPFTKKQIKYGNHAITRVNDSEYSFNFDPLNREIYVPSEEEPGILIGNEARKIAFSRKGTKKFNSRRNFQTAEQLGYLPMEEQINSLNERQEKIIEHKSELFDFKKSITPQLKEADELVKLILKI